MTLSWIKVTRSDGGGIGDDFYFAETPAPDAFGFHAIKKHLPHERSAYGIIGVPLQVHEGYYLFECKDPEDGSEWWAYKRINFQTNNAANNPIIVTLKEVLKFAWAGDPQEIAKEIGRTRHHPRTGHVSWTAVPGKDHSTLIPVHYATDRNASDQSAPDERYGPHCGELRYGRALVSIPPGHLIGRLERPNFWRLELRENPEKHVVLRAVTEMDKGTFFSAVRDYVGRLKRKTAFVFIHGFNVTFPEAAQRAAQLAYDLFAVGDADGETMLSVVPILYSWPSNGKALLYTHDSANAEASAAHLKSFLQEIVDHSGADTLTVIAHSMGNRTLTMALSEIGLVMRKNDLPLIEELVLAAPDIDRRRFFDVVDAVKRTARRMTLYASTRDKPLLLSNRINGFPRLGDATGGVTVFNGADSIDASVVGSDILAHSYYGETDILVDLHAIITRGASPDERFGLLGKGAPPKRYWIMRPRAGM